MADDDRTTPLGLFNYARSYWQSAVMLHKLEPDVPHPEAPVTLLMAHAIELYLKSFLRLSGLSAQELKTNFGHDFGKLVDAAATRGLPLLDKERNVANILTEQESIRRSRYVETGYYRQPSLPALSRTCKSLDQAVAAALEHAGIGIRPAALEEIQGYE